MRAPTWQVLSDRRGMCISDPKTVFHTTILTVDRWPHCVELYRPSRRSEHPGALLVRRAVRQQRQRGCGRARTTESRPDSRSARTAADALPPAAARGVRYRCRRRWHLDRPLITLRLSRPTPELLGLRANTTGTGTVHRALLLVVMRRLRSWGSRNLA